MRLKAAPILAVFPAVAPAAAGLAEAAPDAAAAGLLAGAALAAAETTGLLAAALGEAGAALAAGEAAPPPPQAAIPKAAAAVKGMRNFLNRIRVSPLELALRAIIRSAGARARLEARGFDQVRAVYATRFNEVPDQEFVVARSVVTDSFGEIEGFVTATPAGTFFGLQGHGKPIRVPATVWIAFQDGKLAGERGYMDRVELQRQLLEGAPS
ncbi:MAG: ester cyclase [Chloroflexota bacterium]